ncbi:MAG: glycerol acyltransferase [Aureispira sp.]|nr:glycerol acyltransferase [Aureispira sp.]
MITTILKWIVKITINVFFKRFKVNNKDIIPKEGPMVVVANHPNTLMDPATVGVTLRQKPHFLGKATLFESKFGNWLWSSLRGIPIYRRQDSKTGKVNNDDVFAACYKKLEEKGSILIFPEGVSIQERKLQDIKTGAARIALGAERKNGYKLGVKILVMGLNYSDPTRFRSDLLINVAPLINVKDYYQLHQEDEYAAVRALTAAIEDALKAQMIDIETKEEDLLLTQIDEVYQSRLLKDLGWKATDQNQFIATKGFKEALHHFNHKKSEQVHDLRVKLDSYFNNLGQLQLKDDLFEDSKHKRSILSDGIFRFLYLVLGFPIYLYGLINNYIPYIIPSKLAQAVTKEEVYYAPIKMFSGLLTFTIFYTLQIVLMQVFGGLWWLTLIYAISLPLSAFFTLKYWQRILDTKDHWSLFSRFYQKDKLLHQLIAQRQEIITLLDAAKAEYLLEGAEE